MRPVDDRREVEEALTHYYGVPPHAVDALRFYASSGERLYAASPALAGVDGPAASTRVERVGLYFAAWTGRGLRLSIDGAELVVDAAEPVVEVDAEAAARWMAGEDLPIEGGGLVPPSSTSPTPSSPTGTWSLDAASSSTARSRTGSPRSGGSPGTRSCSAIEPPAGGG